MNCLNVCNKIAYKNWVQQSICATLCVWCEQDQMNNKLIKACHSAITFFLPFYVALIHSFQFTSQEVTAYMKSSMMKQKFANLSISKHKMKKKREFTTASNEYLTDRPRTRICGARRNKLGFGFV